MFFQVSSLDTLLNHFKKKIHKNTIWGTPWDTARSKLATKIGQVAPNGCQKASWVTKNVSRIIKIVISKKIDLGCILLDLGVDFAKICQNL